MTPRATSVCLVALLVAPFLSAADPLKPDAPVKADADAARWDVLQTQLKGIRDEVADLRKRRDTDEKARALEIEFFKDRLEKLEKSLESLKATRRIASSFTPGTPAPTGAIRLENRSAVAATVLLAGKAYRLAPLEAIVLSSQPAGSFTYSVLAEGFGEIRTALTRVLGSGETFTITINP